MTSDDIFLPETGATRTGVKRTAILAFVPIIVALVGVGIVLLGGLSARTGTEAPAVASADVDPVTTGSIAQPDPIGDLLQSTDGQATR